MCVLAPSPLLTVTIEAAAGTDDAEIHLHPGGQGFWVARLLSRLGVDATLCATFGGETGQVIRSLLETEPLSVRWTPTTGTNGAYVDDRRSGTRARVGATGPVSLSRHEVDELYGLALVEGLDAVVCVLGGPGAGAVLPDDVYRRLSADLVANGCTVVADLSAGPLAAAVAGGATVVKVSHEELLRDKRVCDDRVDSLVEAMAELRAKGQQAVVCSRAERPALACFDGRIVEVNAPVIEALDGAGAGDSFTAGMAAALADRQPFETALRLGAAAGGLNVTRRGLGTGDRRAIERLAAHVEINELGPQRSAAPHDEGRNDDATPGDAQPGDPRHHEPRPEGPG